MMLNLTEETNQSQAISEVFLYNILNSHVQNVSNAPGVGYDQVKHREDRLGLVFRLIIIIIIIIMTIYDWHRNTAMPL